MSPFKTHFFCFLYFPSVLHTYEDLIKMFPEHAFGEKTADINHIGGIPAIIEKIAVRM